MPRVEIRSGWLAVIALLAQLVVIYVGFGDATVLRRFIFPSTYVLLLAFVILNRRRIGFLIIGAGMLLNFLAIVTNGGLMPISPEHLQESELAELEPGDSVPNSKNVMLEEEDTQLRWLSDRLDWDTGTDLQVFSVGDFIIGAGLAVVLLELLLPRVQRVSPDRTSPT
jgi:hypothetical protein